MVDRPVLRYLFLLSLGAMLLYLQFYLKSEEFSNSLDFLPTSYASLLFSKLLKIDSIIKKRLNSRQIEKPIAHKKVSGNSKIKALNPAMEIAEAFKKSAPIVNHKKVDINTLTECSATKIFMKRSIDGHFGDSFLQRRRNSNIHFRIGDVVEHKKWSVFKKRLTTFMKYSSLLNSHFFIRLPRCHRRLGHDLQSPWTLDTSNARW